MPLEPLVPLEPFKKTPTTKNGAVLFFFKKDMNQETLYIICGYVASIGMILGYLPQAISTIRTRNTDGIALPTFLMMAIGALAFVIQGLLHKDGIIWSMVITNAVTCSCSCVVFAIKIHNDYFKKKD